MGDFEWFTVLCVFQVIGYALLCISVARLVTGEQAGGDKSDCDPG